jgi:tartrate dehydrogenase/decarboxylase/D-malate dehydrogenase
MKMFKIAIIPGDGIGKEVVPEGLRVLDAAGRRFGLKFSCKNFDWSCETYLKTGKMMPDDGLEQLRPFDAILRPVRLLKGIESPLKNVEPGQIDFCVVRENNEGEYSDVGGRIFRDTDEEMAMQQTIFTRRGVDRILRYAFELARKRKSHVTSATKSNGIIHTMPFWDERFHAIGQEFPDVRTDQYHIDILTAHFVRHPDWFDVVVGSNLFGDILSDLGPAVAGSIGIAPSANLNPERKYPSMFEPVHGSAPDIAGKGIANPIGQIWSGAMMLRHFGEAEAADAIERAIEDVLAKPESRTPDVGGKATTEMVGKAIASRLAG